MGKYAPLGVFFRSLTSNRIEITFEQLDRLVKGGLPASIWNHAAWWANSQPGDSHVWAHQWMEAGWKCTSADRQSGVACFERTGKPATHRLPVGELRKVTPEHIWNAVQALLCGAEAEGYGPSTDYDLIVDGGARLAPKQVFGLAATSALGFVVTHSQFTGGRGTVCFQMLEDSGYMVEIGRASCRERVF